MGFLPISAADMRRAGIEQLDFVYIIGDAYVDHPSFGHAYKRDIFYRNSGIQRIRNFDNGPFSHSIGKDVRLAHGYRVGIISQPDWKDDQSIAVLGRPRLGFLISAGNMDSMVPLSRPECRARCLQIRDSVPAVRRAPVLQPGKYQAPAFLS